MFAAFVATRASQVGNASASLNPTGTSKRWRDGRRLRAGGFVREFGRWIAQYAPIWVPSAVLCALLLAPSAAMADQGPNLSGAWESGSVGDEYFVITSGTSTSIAGTYEDQGYPFRHNPAYVLGTLSGSIINGTGEIYVTYNGAMGTTAGRVQEYAVTHYYPATATSVPVLEGFTWPPETTPPSPFTESGCITENQANPGSCYRWSFANVEAVPASGLKSSTEMQCAAVAGQEPLTCTATVSEVGDNGSVKVPTGEVSFSATAGSFQTPGCSLVATNAVQASCSVTFTPPKVNSGSSGTQITANYAGDSNFLPSSASFTLCADGKLLELESITTATPHANGFELNAPVVLHGCGFAAGMGIKWGGGANKEEVSAGSIGANGTQISMTVPWGATSGDVTATAADNTSTLANQTVDSWRNTEGLSLPNFSSPIYRQEFVDAFAATKMTEGTRPNGEPKLLAEYENIYNAETDVHGLCFGFSLLTSTLADGTTNADADGYGTAATPYALRNTSRLEEAIKIDYLKQLSSEAKLYDFRRKLSTSGAVIQTQLEAALGSDGYRKPALIGIDWTTSKKNAQGKVEENDVGHSVTAFAVRSNSGSKPGEFEILTYNSNYPFDAGENSSPEEHEKGLENSVIKVESNGNWTMPGQDASGGPTELEIMPTAAVEGPLHLQTSGITNNVGKTTRLESATGPTSSLPVDLTGSGSNDVLVTPISTQAGSASQSSGPGIGGIAALEGPTGHWAETIAEAGGPESDSFIGPTGSAWLQASPGADQVGFDSSKDTFAITPAGAQHPSRSATMTLISKTKSAGERILTVSGPIASSHTSISLVGSHATVSSAVGGKLNVELAVEGGGVLWQTYDAGSIHLGAGETLSLTPTNWTRLASGRISASLGTKKGKHTVKLHNHFRAPNAKVVRSSITPTGHTADLNVTLSTPRLSAAASAEVFVAIRHAGNLITRAHDAISIGTVRRSLLTIPLPKTVPAGSTAQFEVVTEVGGTTPSTARTKRTLMLHR